MKEAFIDYLTKLNLSDAYYEYPPGFLTSFHLISGFFSSTNYSYNRITREFVWECLKEAGEKRKSARALDEMAQENQDMGFYERD